MILMKNIDKENGQLGPTDLKGKKHTITIIIVCLASLAIVILMTIYYVVLSKPLPNPEISSVVLNRKPTPTSAPTPIFEPTPTPIPEFKTSVINFDYRTVAPSEMKQGSCPALSLAQPFRQDAFKCSAGNQNYDPCFSFPDGKSVICQNNPLLENSAVLITLTNPLPSPVTSQAKDNWAWFVKLEDGTMLTPYSPSRSIAGEKAFYGSSISNNQRTVIIGDLQKSDTSWSAKVNILVLQGKQWVVKSSETARLKTVWR